MRTEIQQKLEEIENIEIGEFRADDILEAGETYFGYQLTNNYVNTDYDSTYQMRANINGYVSRLEDSTENTLLIVDNITQEIIEKLKEKGFRTTYQDVSIDNGVRKVHITGYAVAQDNKLIGGK